MASEVRVAAGTRAAGVRRLADQEEWRSICGMRRDLVGLDEEGAANIHYMRISDSRRHRHLRTTEYYYVTEGRGEMELDDQVVQLAPGDLVTVPTGTWHTARPAAGAELHILLIAAPGGTATAADIEFEEAPPA